VRFVVAEAGFRLDPSVAADVLDVHSVSQRDSRHQQASVAIGRVLLCAHGRDPHASRAVQQPLHAGGEELRLSYEVIADVSLGVVVTGVIWPAPKLLAQEDVADALFAKAPLKDGLIEAGGVSGMRPGAHVGDGLDPVADEEVEEVLERVIRVPDGEQQ
jgi:hypothetical protein